MCRRPSLRSHPPQALLLGGYLNPPCPIYSRSINVPECGYLTHTRSPSIPGTVLALPPIHSSWMELICDRPIAFCIGFLVRPLHNPLHFPRSTAVFELPAVVLHHQLKVSANRENKERVPL